MTIQEMKTEEARIKGRIETHKNLEEVYKTASTESRLNLLTDVMELFMLLANIRFDIIAELEKSPWVSVAERLPETDQKIFVKTSNGDFDSCFFWRDNCIVPMWQNKYGDCLQGVTHWMEIPK